MTTISRCRINSAMHAVHVLKLSPPSQHLFNTLVNYRKNPSPTAEARPTGVQFDLISAEDGMEFDIVLTSTIWEISYKSL
ncbi:hypothetical protein SCUP234_07809 [Seiridium cupressi]